MHEYLEQIVKESGVTIPHTALEKSIYNNGNRTAIANVSRKALRGEDITICAFGGSITRGSGSDVNPLEESGIRHSLDQKDYNYLDYVCEFWENAFSCKVTKVNAGMGATDTVYGVHRMEEDVLQYHPDLVIVEWCCNDGKDQLYKQATYEAIVRRLLETNTALIILSMATARGVSSQILHEPISDWYAVPMISYRDAYGDMQEYRYLSTDGTHPNKVGYALAGLLVNHFLMETLQEQEHIDRKVSTCREDVFCEESMYYHGAKILTLKDIHDGKIEGARITDMGSFDMDKEVSKFVFREYYGFTARYAEQYAPLVIELDVCKTLFLQIYRNTVFWGTDFYVELNGKKRTSNTFTCKHGTDNTQVEWSYHWATERLCNHPTAEKVVLKIYPAVANKEAFVRLFALLVS